MPAALIIHSCICVNFKTFYDLAYRSIKISENQLIFFFNLTNLKPGDGFDAVEHDQARDAFRIGRRVDHRHPAAHGVTNLKIKIYKVKVETI